MSVIVPVYGVEAYIARCARSLFRQTLEDIEFIFVNDCTQDRSIDILEDVLEKEYPFRKRNTRIITMPQNSGQAQVRRVGIQCATGDYIINCDSDDWVDEDAYKQMYNSAIETNSEMVFCSYCETDGKHILPKKIFATWNNKETLLGELISGKIKGSLSCVLVKRKLFENHLFSFPKGDMTEDVTSIVQLVYIADRISYIDKNFYYYYHNPLSITNTVTKKMCEKRFRDSFINTRLIERFFEETRMPFKREIILRKIDTLSQLYPCLSDYEYLRLWRYAFKGMLREVTTTRIGFRTKFKYLVTYLGLYPLWLKLHGYKSAV